MRVLVATTAGSGHFGPLVPFAVALKEAGHDVAVAAPESFAAAVTRAGFVHQPFGDASQEELGAVFATLPGRSNEEGNALVIGEVFGRIDTRAALPAMAAMVAEWKPDLIVRETCEFASYIAAEAAGVPHAQVAVGLAAFEERGVGVLEEPLTSLGAEPGLAGLRAAPRLTMVPESFEDPAATGGEGTRRFRDGVVTGNADPLPDWWRDESDPLVYVTFGSVAAGFGLFPDLYRAAIDVLAGVPIRVLLTLGDAGAPEALEPVPANVHVEKWWPQKAVMPHASAMVGHGGYGTTLSGLTAGVPQVVVPLFADQPHNARRVDAVGAGVALEGGPGAVAGLASAVTRVLADERYRVGAGRIAAEIAGLPPASEAVPVLEALAGR
ncbi:MAG: glycosyltransferase [Acidimicrobiales bacterium]